MQVPLFALQTRDIKPFKWESKNGAITVTITPPAPKEGESQVPGRATIHDKDILIFLTSALVAAINHGESMPASRRVRFTAHHFFQATGKDCSKDGYERLKAALERLTRTYVRIHYRDRKVTLWKQKDEGFNLVSYWSAVTDEKDERMSAIVVDLSEPLADAITQRAVLTLHPDYFKIRQPLAKRLYELARKHCGKQGAWKVGLDTLQHACGSTRDLRNFRGDVKKIIEGDAVPGYKLHIEVDDIVTVFDRDPARLIEEVIKPVRRPRKKAVDK
jgi:plasmid replication initiation protein